MNWSYRGPLSSLAALWGSGGHDGGPLTEILANLRVGDGRPLTEILANLYVGDAGMEADLPYLQRHGVTHVLQVAVELRANHAEALKYKRIEIDDMPMVQLVPHLQEAFDFIDQGRKEGKVFVHCLAGVSRSVSTCVAYVMRQNHVDFDTALDTVRAARPQAHPNRGFELQLRLLHALDLDLDRWPGWGYDLMLRAGQAAAQPGGMQLWAAELLQFQKARDSEDSDAAAAGQHLPV